MYIHIFLCIYIYLYVCIYIYTCTGMHDGRADHSSFLPWQNKRKSAYMHTYIYMAGWPIVSYVSYSEINAYIHTYTWQSGLLYPVCHLRRGFLSQCQKASLCMHIYIHTYIWQGGLLYPVCHLRRGFLRSVRKRSYASMYSSRSFPEKRFWAPNMVRVRVCAHMHVYIHAWVYVYGICP